MSYLPHDADSLVFSLLFFPFSTFSTSFLFFSFSFSFLLSLSLLSSSLSFSLSYLLSLFFLIHLFALSLHASSLRHKKITRGPEQCTILPHIRGSGKKISVTELASVLRWPQFNQHTWNSLLYLFLNSSSSWRCFRQEFPLERGLWVPGEETASHAQSDWLPGCQQQGQCHHDWP